MQKHDNPHTLNSVDRIPFPEYNSWMFTRTHIKELSIEEKQNMWKNQPKHDYLLESIMSRILIKGGLLKPNFRHVLFKLITRYFLLYFKLQNRFRVYGREKIPKNGCIFYLNHPGSYDPLIFFAASQLETGAIFSWGNGWFMDMLERVYGQITRYWFRSGDELIERMIRVILQKNRYFAIWPEGHPTQHGYVKQGFSSVAKVYATINCKEDKIPFMPVLIRGSGVYMHKPGIHRGAIEVHFLDPFFLPREWLRLPEEGGKPHAK